MITQFGKFSSQTGIKTKRQRDNQQVHHFLFSNGVGSTAQAHWIIYRIENWSFIFHEREHRAGSRNILTFGKLKAR